MNQSKRERIEARNPGRCTSLEAIRRMMVTAFPRPKKRRKSNRQDRATGRMAERAVRGCRGEDEAHEIALKRAMRGDLSYLCFAPDLRYSSRAHYEALAFMEGDVAWGWAGVNREVEPKPELEVHLL